RRQTTHSSNTYIITPFGFDLKSITSAHGRAFTGVSCHLLRRCNSMDFFSVYLQSFKNLSRSSSILEQSYLFKALAICSLASLYRWPPLPLMQRYTRPVNLLYLFVVPAIFES